jgi:microcystin-dependent protein
MANYGAIKTMKGAAIGTIMPWTGDITRIPKGWVICNGKNLLAKDYPLLAQCIGNTYGGSVGFTTNDFPWALDPVTTFTLPDINQKALTNTDLGYFAGGAVGAINPDIDTAQAAIAVGAFVGANSDNGAPNRIDDAYADIVFSYTPENDFNGAIDNATFNPGVGSKTIFTGPRKLGRRHVPIHTHPTDVPSIGGINRNQPGAGVSCSREVTYNFQKAGSDDAFGSLSQIAVEIVMPGGTGFGNGTPGIMLGNIDSENPGPNLIPRNVISHGISNWIGSLDGPDVPDPLLQPSNDAVHTRRFNPSDTAPYGLGGSNIDTEHRNYDDSNFTDPDTGLVGGPGANGGDGVNPDIHIPYEVFFNHSGIDFTKTVPAAAGQPQDRIDAHDHTTFQINYDRTNSSLRMPATITINDVQSNVTPNNIPDALNITTTIPTPKLLVVYVIRAY